jgi:hypothetical protein
MVLPIPHPPLSLFRLVGPTGRFVLFAVPSTNARSCGASLPFRLWRLHTGVLPFSEYREAQGSALCDDPALGLASDWYELWIDPPFGAIP